MSLGSGQSGVLGVTGRDVALGDSANYYMAISPTAGTGITNSAGATLVQTTPSMVVFNGGLLNVYLLWLRISVLTAGGGANTKNFTHSIDQGNRFSSGGTQLTVNNTNIMSNVKSSVQATFGAITASAATANNRTLFNSWFRTTLADVAGDVYEFQYGAPSGVGVGSSVATVANFVHSVPAIVLQPQSCYLLNVWSTAAAGMVAEIQLAFAEK